MRTTDMTVVEHGSRPPFIDDIFELFGEPEAGMWSDAPDVDKRQMWGWQVQGKLYRIIIVNRSAQFGSFVTYVHGYGELELRSLRYPTYAQLRDMCRVVSFPEGTEPQVTATIETSGNTLDATPRA